MAYDFSGKKVLVTGGARGIGKQIVKRLVKYSAEVIALDINKENLDILKIEIPSVQTVHADLSDWSAARSAVEEHGMVDMLVNNAGIVRRGSFEEITEDDLDSLFAVIVKPIVNLSQVFIKALKEHGREGAIVNTSSITSTKYVRECSAYAMCKAAVDRLTKTMAVELAAYGIRVNAVNPTGVLTETMKSILMGPTSENFKNSIPLKKFAEMDDVAAAVIFLLSDEAKLITGTCLLVDGGQAIA